jgi:hypothetical protein
MGGFDYSLITLDPKKIRAGHQRHACDRVRATLPHPYGHHCCMTTGVFDKDKHGVPQGELQNRPAVSECAKHEANVAAANQAAARQAAANNAKIDKIQTAKCVSEGYGAGDELFCCKRSFAESGDIHMVDVYACLAWKAL